MSRPYHHGNLPLALVEAGAALLDEGGPAALTLREVAARLGVSRTAPYRHYRDKNELLAAVAEQGFRQLSHRLRKARAAGHGRAALAAVTAAYVGFASERPARYRLMFSAELAGDPRLPAHAEQLRRLLVDTTRAAAVAPSTPGPEGALLLWSILHGLAYLCSDGGVPPTQALLERAAGAMLATLACASG